VLLQIVFNVIQNFCDRFDHTLVPRGIHYNTLVTFLQHFCNGLLCVGDPKVCVKYSKALQNCYKYVANMILVCLCTVGKSGVENVLCLCLKSVANGERNYLILPSFTLVLQRISNFFEMHL
jgi:hypothetical protein